MHPTVLHAQRLSEACYDLAEVLNLPGVRPGMVERALNAFTDVLDFCGGAGSCDPAILTALRQGKASVNRGVLSSRTFAEMARAVRRHLEDPVKWGVVDLLPALHAWNRSALGPARTAAASATQAPARPMIRIQDVVEVLSQRGGAVYPHGLKTGLANRFPLAAPAEVEEAYERALSSYALTITPMGKVCRYPRD